MLNKDHIISYRVYFEDTDLMGIVYHARYLCFFERARTELLRSQGLSLTALAKLDTHFAIRSLNVNYHYPARLDDVLSVVTALDYQKSCTLLFKQKMLNQDNKLISEAIVTAVTVDSSLKPKRRPILPLGEEIV